MAGGNSTAVLTGLTVNSWPLISVSYQCSQKSYYIDLILTLSHSQEDNCAAALSNLVSHLHPILSDGGASYLSEGKKKQQERTLACSATTSTTRVSAQSTLILWMNCDNPSTR